MNTKLTKTSGFGLVLALIVANATIVACDQVDGFSKKEIAMFVSKNPLPIPNKKDFLNSLLQDISISWIKITGWSGGGGAISAREDLLLILDPSGTLHWIDLASLSGPYSTNINVPNRRGKLISSAYSKRINVNWFRVTGAYAEPLANGIRLFVVHHVFAKNCFFLQVSSIDLSFSSDVGIIEKQPWKIIFRPHPCIHLGDTRSSFAGNEAGGRIISLDQDYLLVSYGDHGLDGSGDAANSPQDVKLPYGKIWKVAKDGSGSTIHAIGVRNPQGLFFDKDRRKIWETEHGPEGGDELNVITANKNYGWPSQTYGVDYGGSAWPLNTSQGRHSSEEYEAPVFAWVPDIAPTNLTKVIGPKFPLWHGDLLLATLRDQAIHRLRLSGEHVVYDERIKLGRRLVDILALNDGTIIVLTNDGAIGLIDDPEPKFP